MSLITCTYAGCGESFAKPVKGQRRITSKSVWLCPHCKGEIARPSTTRSAKV